MCSTKCNSNTNRHSLPYFKTGFTHLCTTSQHVYALYSGKYIKDYPGPDVAFGDQVFVFDWEGNPVVSYRLDREVVTIFVDEAGEKLYAGTEVANGIDIVVYAL